MDATVLYILNGLLTILVAAGGFIIKGQAEAIKDLQADLKAIPEVYARRDDVKDGFKEIKEMLQRLDNKWSGHVQ